MTSSRRVNCVGPAPGPGSTSALTRAHPPTAARVEDDECLLDTSFVVIDLETTGASPATDRITEIGAVKVRGGQVLGEFATLVDPGVLTSGAAAGLTGITMTTLASAPRLSAVLPSLLSFVEGAVVVDPTSPANGCRPGRQPRRRPAESGTRRWPPGRIADQLPQPTRPVSPS